MREERQPLWEDPAICYGGTWRLKCMKKDTVCRLVPHCLSKTVMSRVNLILFMTWSINGVQLFIALGATMTPTLGPQMRDIEMSTFRQIQSISFLWRGAKYESVTHFTYPYCSPAIQVFLFSFGFPLVFRPSPQGLTFILFVLWNNIYIFKNNLLSIFWSETDPPPPLSDNDISILSR